MKSARSIAIPTAPSGPVDRDRHHQHAAVLRGLLRRQPLRLSTGEEFVTSRPGRQPPCFVRVYLFLNCRPGSEAEDAIEHISALFLSCLPGSEDSGDAAPLFSTFLSCLPGSEVTEECQECEVVFLSCLPGSEGEGDGVARAETFLSCLPGSEGYCRYSVRR